MLMGVSLGHSSTPHRGKEGEEWKHSHKDYGTIGWEFMAETLDCPTCRGTGRIPRGQENQLVAVIPCTDQRLKPRHTKQYVCLSVVLCLVVCFLVLFFLFPRSMSLSPIAIKSVLVFFTPDAVTMTIMSVLNISNENFVTVEVRNLDVQALIVDTVVGKASIGNVTIVKPRSRTEYTFDIPVSIEDAGLSSYCKSTSIKIRTLFFHLQIMMRVFYLAHSEQLSMDAFEYVDCGTNTTVSHIMQDTSLCSWGSKKGSALSLLCKTPL
ncbi:transmembrane protein 106A isoform X1 [Scleropages formosus]|uniref:Transmembrane protein 106A n=3 Tax=Scleropages formosus TaxID=113540 RepID=A0A8C9RJF5_SCLFO|nr:transmembrane protein 106B-like isoform X1 [Scleropages formosus]